VCFLMMSVSSIFHNSMFSTFATVRSIVCCIDFIGNSFNWQEKQKCLLLRLKVNEYSEESRYVFVVNVTEYENINVGKIRQRKSSTAVVAQRCHTSRNIVKMYTR
jgi:hypothetical protein